MKSIGIEISPTGIAVVQLHADRSSYSITKGHFFPLQPLDVGNWELDLLQALKEIKSLYDLDNCSVCVSLPQSSASSRNLNFPFSRRLDVLRSLPFELEEELPMGVEDGIFDAKTISVNNNGTSILAYAVRKDDIEKTLEIFSRLEIEPDILTIESSAFANLYENWSAGSFLQSHPESIPFPLQLRFFFRHDSTLITVFRERQMIFARSIPWGEKNIIHELMREYNYPYQQAESIIPEQTRVLLSLADASADDIKTSHLIEQSLAPFLNEVRLMFIDLQDRFQSPVGSALITGKIADIENINGVFTKYFGVPFNTERLDGDVFSTPQITALFPHVDKLSIAVGAAIEAFKKPRNPAINFRQHEFAKRNLFLEKAWVKWGNIIILAGIIYSSLIVYGFVRDQIASGLDDLAFEQLQKTAAKIANIPETRVSVENVQDYLDEEKEKFDNLQVFEKVQDVEPAMKVIETLSQELPPSKLNKFDIRRVDVKFASVTIEGEAQQPNTVNTIRKKLEAMSSNKKVETLNPTIKKISGTAFAFRIRTKG